LAGKIRIQILPALHLADNRAPCRFNLPRGDPAWFKRLQPEGTKGYFGPASALPFMRHASACAI
jgi:hypothetical protein